MSEPANDSIIPTTHGSWQGPPSGPEPRNTRRVRELYGSAVESASEPLHVVINVRWTNNSSGTMKQCAPPHATARRLA